MPSSLHQQSHLLEGDEYVPCMPPAKKKAGLQVFRDWAPQFGPLLPSTGPRTRARQKERQTSPSWFGIASAGQPWDESPTLCFTEFSPVGTQTGALVNCSSEGKF